MVSWEARQKRDVHNCICFSGGGVALHTGRYGTLLLCEPLPYLEDVVAVAWLVPEPPHAWWM